MLCLKNQSGCHGIIDCCDIVAFVVIKSSKTIQCGFCSKSLKTIQSTKSTLGCLAVMARKYLLVTTLWSMVGKQMLWVKLKIVPSRCVPISVV